MELRKRKRLVFASLGAVVFAFGIWFLFLRNTEPSYKGKRLSEWLSSYGMYVPKSDEARPAAHAAIRAIGMDGLPFLLVWIADPPQDSFVREKVYEALVHRPELIRRRVPDGVWDWATQRSKDELFESVPEAFSALGPDAASAIPRLRALRDSHSHPRVRWKATLALAGLDADEISPLVDAIRHGDGDKFDERWIDANWAFVNYPSLRTNIASVVPALIDCLRRGNPTAVQTLRISALDCGQSHIILPALANVLADPDPKVRTDAAEAIAEITRHLQEHE